MDFLGLFVGGDVWYRGERFEKGLNIELLMFN